MTPTEIAMLLSIAVTIGEKAYGFISSLSEGKIPSWSELMAKNAELQAKIDAEK